MKLGYCYTSDLAMDKETPFRIEADVEVLERLMDMFSSMADQDIHEGRTPDAYGHLKDWDRLYKLKEKYEEGDGNG